MGGRPLERAARRRRPDRPGSSLLLASITLHFVAWGMMEPLVPLFVLALGGSRAMVGVVVAAASVLPLLLSVWLGALTDRVGTRRAMLIGGCGMMVAFGLYAATRSLLLLGLAQACFGVFHLWKIIPAQAWLSRIAGDDLYRLFGYYGFASTLGQLLGPLAGGFLLEHAPAWMPVPHGGYVAAFLAGLALSALSMGLSLLLPKADGPAGSQAAGGGRGWRHALAVAAEPRLFRLITCSLLFWLAIALRRSYFPVYLSGVGLSPSLVGGLLSLYSLVGLVCRPLLGVLVARFGQVRLMETAFAVTGLVLLCVPAVHSAPALGLLAAMWGFAHSIGMPVIMAMTTDVVPMADRGLAVGIRSAANRTAEVGSPLLFGLLTGLVGLEWAFVVAAPFVAGGIGVLAGLRARAGRPAGPRAG